MKNLSKRHMPRNCEPENTPIRSSARFCAHRSEESASKRGAESCGAE